MLVVNECRLLAAVSLHSEEEQPRKSIGPIHQAPQLYVQAARRLKMLRRSNGRRRYWRRVFKDRKGEKEGGAKTLRRRDLCTKENL
jgi:hypothetical protein